MNAQFSIVGFDPMLEQAYTSGRMELTPPKRNLQSNSLPTKFALNEGL